MTLLQRVLLVFCLAGLLSVGGGLVHALHHHDQHAGHAAPAPHAEKCGICQLIAASSKATIEPPNSVSFEPAEIPRTQAVVETELRSARRLGPPVERGPPSC